MIGQQISLWLTEGISGSIIQTLVGYLRSQVLLRLNQRNHRLGQLGEYSCQCTKSCCDCTNNVMVVFPGGQISPQSTELN